MRDAGTEESVFRGKKKAFDAGWKRLGLLAVTAGVSATALPDAKEKPNILFVAVDDLRPLLGCYGNEQMQTPNLDRLAARGVVFDADRPRRKN